ncbi:MAG: ATP-dependent DNA helicase [Candidatus Saccharibacteria bacterium]|nr:ATP-dependent DNA helicase [Candidatus Saccharibacteria bacterium]
MEFEKAYQNLNEQQRAAVDHIDGPLLVIAGPGTGKTQLLSVRVANILQQTDVSPENILCLTFTETGASNMRKRLSDFIGPEAYKVQIQTYHAFGSYILQEHRPDLNTAIDELERFTLIREIQSTLHPTDILRPEHQTSKIISAISDLKAAALSPDDIRHIVERNQIDSAKIYATIEEDIQATKGLRFNKAEAIYERILAAIESAATAPSTPEYIVGKIEPISKIYYRSLKEALLKEQSAEKPSTKLLGEWRKKFFKVDKTGRYVFGDEIANKKLLSLANIMELYAEKLRTLGMFDYDDMILYAIVLLKNDAEIRYNAQERFQYILLDEFQDTNDAQAQLVSLLTDNPVNEGRPNIMAVGDDDQAIYGFQGANTSNFFDFDEKYHPEHIFLTKNYRSSAPILDFAHNVIEQSLDRFCKSPNVNIDKNITAENPPDNTEIELREFPAYQEEYSFVAQKIQNLLDSGVSGEKIAIIAPKHKYLVSILPYLHKLNIPVSYARRENILENPQIIELFNACNLLLALKNSLKAADPYWFEVLSLNCWNISAAKVIEIIQNARNEHKIIIEQMLADESEDVKNVAAYFVELAAKVDSYSADFIIANLAAKLFADTDNYDFYSNLNTLRDTLLNKSTNKKLLLRDFCDIITAYNNAEMAILNKSPYHESDTAVQLQTVHSAKGLEYEYVFLIAADNKNWSEARGNTDQITLPRNLEHVRHTGDSADEKIRVFFVAITRAKANLCLTYSLSDFAGHETDRLKYLDEREDENKTLISKIIPEPFAKVIQSHCTDIAPELISPDMWFDQYVPDDETRKNLLKPRVEHYRISPTHLNTFLDLRYGNGPYSFLQNYILYIPSETNFAMNYGKYIHEIMDEINKENITNEQAIERFMAKIDAADAEDIEKDDLKKRAEAELPKFLAERGDLLRNTNAESERGFFTETITLSDAILTGKIDRVEIDEEHKTITVSDFKTGNPKHKWSTNDSTFAYKIQLYFYKFLLEGSRDYKNYKVTDGRIDYISPDEEDDIVSLSLKFNDKEAAEIKHLIQVVFRHIKALDFPDITDAQATSNPTKAFYDQLIAEA